MWQAILFSSINIQGLKITSSNHSFQGVRRLRNIHSLQLGDSNTVIKLPAVMKL